MTWPSTVTSPVFSDFGFQHRVLSQPPHQHAGAAVHEALGQALVQRIGQLVLDRAGNALPMLRIGKPIRAIGDESPGPDMRDPVGKGIDVAVGSVGLGNLASEPVGRDVTLSHQESIEGHHKFGMGRRRDLAVVGDLADIPQPLDRLPLFAQARRTSSSRAACSKTRMSSAVGARVRPCSVGVTASDACKAPIEEKSSAGIAPLQHAHRLEAVALQRLHQFRLERIATSGRAEGAVAGRAAGAAGDLRQLGRIELAELIAVEFAVGGKGDVIDVEIEPHADGVGGDQVIDVARLVERDLRVAGARRERAQHHRGAAALAADQFGDGVDFLGRERDDGRARAAAGSASSRRRK